MIPLGKLLAEIWLADSSFHIIEGAFHGKVRMENTPRDVNDKISIETDSLGLTIQKVWSLLYDKENYVTRRY